MPSCTFGDSLNEFYRETKEDIEGMFGDEDMLMNVDITNVNIDDVDLSVFDTTCCEDSDDDMNSQYVRGNHDCMLGGYCCDKGLQKTEPPVPPPLPAPSFLITHSSNQVVTIQKCSPAGSDSSDVVAVTNNTRTTPVKTENRSLLLNRSTVQLQQQTPFPPAPANPQTTPARVIVKRESRPETPMSLVESDDDYTPIPIVTPVDNSDSIFRSALGVLSATSTIGWDPDVFVFTGRTKVEEPSKPSQTDLLRISAVTNNDHNYDGSSKDLSLEGLGVDTPSDSEEDEEIDVESLSERSSSSGSSSCGGSGQPVRPTCHDRGEQEEITFSLLSASQAVSRKLKKTISNEGRLKRKHYQSDSSEDEDVPIYQRQVKRQRVMVATPPPQRRKKHRRFGLHEDSKEKRKLHNNMERMRRVDLRNSFDDLKYVVPRVANKDRVAKVVILREAANYCHELGAESQSMYLQIMALRKQQERLRMLLSSLRKAACVSRRRRR